ncbi:MAG: hypothetical protein ACTSRZ_18215 [Promethearchaeota archaeon]
MGKKKGVSSTKYKHAGLIKFLAALGAGISMVYHAFSIVNAFSGGGSPDLLQSLFYPLIGIVLDIMLLGSLELVNHKWVFEVSWLSLLIIAVIEAILNATVGTLLIVIAAIIALIDRI